jgi:hypothetical protein
MAPARDFPNEQKLFSSLQFSPRDIAVLDVRPDFATVNWTTRTTPAEFLDRAVELARHDVAAVTFRYAGEETDADLAAISDLAADPGFSEFCDFIRLDVGSWRSYAWQHIGPPATGGTGDAGYDAAGSDSPGFDVVGFGDDVKALAIGTQPVGDLLEATASQGLPIAQVLTELDRLLRAVPGIHPLEY